MAAWLGSAAPGVPPIIAARCAARARGPAPLLRMAAAAAAAAAEAAARLGSVSRPRRRGGSMPTGCMRAYVSIDTSPVDCARETSSSARTKAAKSRKPWRRLSELAHTRARMSRGSSLRSKKRTASCPVSLPSLSASAIWNQRRYISCTASLGGVPAGAPGSPPIAGRGGGPAGAPGVLNTAPTPAPIGEKNCWSPARRAPLPLNAMALPCQQAGRAVAAGRWRRRRKLSGAVAAPARCSLYCCS